MDILTTGLLTTGVAAILGMGAAALVATRAAWIGRRFGLIDQPDGMRKTHARPTPLVGGLAILLPVIVALLGSAAVSAVWPLLLTLAGATAVALAVGLADDRRHVSPLMRLALSTVAGGAALAAVPDLTVEFFRFSAVPRALFMETGAPIFTVICLIGLQNAVNMADGRNGLVIGMALIWTALLLMYAPPALTPVLAVLAGALVVTLVFNLRERLFLGDCGTYGLAMFFGLVAIHSHNIGFARLPSDMVMLWFLVPVADCLRVMFTRLARGRSPFSPDRGHLHHLLNDLMPWRWGLVAYLALIAVPCFLAALEPALTLPLALVTLTCYTLVVAFKGRMLSRRSTELV